MPKIPSHILTAPADVGVAVPPGAFHESTKTLVDFTRAIGGEADRFLEIGQEAQAIENDRSVRSNIRGMREMEAQHLEWARTPDENGNTPDPSTWVPEFKKRLDEYQAGIKAAGVPPVVVEATMAKFEDFAGAGLLGIGALAFKENRKRAIETEQLDLNDLAREGRWDEGRELIKNSGLIDDIAERRALADWNDKQVDYELRLGGREDPRKLKKDLEAGKWKSLPDDQRAVEIDRAQAQVETMENRALGVINGYEDDGLIKNRDQMEEHVQMMVEQGKLTPKLAERRLRLYDRTKPLTEKERRDFSVRIYGDRDAFLNGEIDLDEYRRRHTTTGTELRVHGKRNGIGEFNDISYRFNPSNMKAGSEKEMREQLEAMRKEPHEVVKEFVRERLKGGLSVSVAENFDPDDDPDPVKKAEYIKKQDEFNVALHTELERAGSRWVNQQPVPPTPAEVIKHLESIFDTTSRRVNQELQDKMKPTSREALDRANYEKWKNTDGQDWIFVKGARDTKGYKSPTGGGKANIPLPRKGDAGDFPADTDMPNYLLLK